MSAVTGPLPFGSAAMRRLELRMWLVALLAYAASQSGDVESAIADEINGTVALSWEGTRYDARITVTESADTKGGNRE